jgi:hypothetical protein
LSDLVECEDVGCTNSDLGIYKLPFERQRCLRLSVDVPQGIVVVFPGVLFSAHIAHHGKVIAREGDSATFSEFRNAASLRKCPENVSPATFPFTSLSDMKVVSSGATKGTILNAPCRCSGDSTFFEYWSVLTAVQQARHQFVMAELGAGWGRWAAIGAVAARSMRIPFQLILLEASPIHYQFMLNTMSLNSIAEHEFMAVLGAATKEDSTVSFLRSDPDMHYGASVLGPQQAEGAGKSNVLGYSLKTLFAPYWFVDFVHFDIQYSELEVFVSSASVLLQRVKRIYVECHSPELFYNVLDFIMENLNWDIEYEIAPGSEFTDNVHGHIGAVNPFIS